MYKLKQKEEEELGDRKINPVFYGLLIKDNKKINCYKGHHI